MPTPPPIPTRPLPPVPRQAGGTPVVCSPAPARLIGSFLAVVLYVLIVLVCPQKILAETQTSTISGNLVTATVPDHTDPSAPILVSPTNNSTVTSQKPPFTWEPSTDDVGVSSYRLTVDGVVFISSIATSATENSTYKLEVNGDGSLKLTPKNSLADGAHTWRITAFDAAGNSEDSATWTFSIDSQAPHFTLTKIGTTTVSVSAQNSATWSTTPFVVTSNPAELVATTEGSSEVEVKVYWGGSLQQTVTTSASSGGNWSTMLGIVPRDTVITLDFLIRDSVGLTTVLEDVLFTVPGLELPNLGGGTTPSPTPTGTLVVPGEVVPTSEPTALSPSPTPTPPRSIVATILDWSWPGGSSATPAETSIPLIQEILLTITLHLPEAIAKPFQQALTTPPAAHPWWWSLAALLAFLLWLTATWLWYFSQWRSDWLRAGSSQWRRVLGPWWVWKNADGSGGMVLSREYTDAQPENSPLTPLRFAKITLLSRALTSRESTVLETFFTDHTGRFMSPNWPPAVSGGTAGQYALSVFAPGESTTAAFMDLPKDWPKTFSVFSFLHHQYRGGWLSLRKELPFPSLTVLSRTEKMSGALTIFGRVLGAGTSLETSWAVWLIFSALCSSVWGGLINWVMVLFFGVVGGVRLYQRSKLKAWPITGDDSDAEWLIVTTQSLPAAAWCVPALHKTALLPAQLTQVIMTEIDGVAMKQTKGVLELASAEKTTTKTPQSYLN